jgi:hypothetical protein
MSTVNAPPAPSGPVSETSDETTGRSAAQDLDESGFGPAALAAMGSVALALYYYYVRGEKQRGEFVGLWPATILGLATYLRLGDIKQRLDEAEE